jgi:uncharacterized iron-regulated membrane protein
LAGDTGRTINGFVAIVTLVLAGAGLVIWWPGRRNWRFGLVYLRGARWQRQNYDLHKLAGFYSSLALVVVAFSGAYFSFPHLYQQVIAGVTGTRVSMAAPRAASLWTERRVPLEEFIRTAEQAQQGAHAISFSFPQKKGDAVNIRLKETHDWHRIGLNFVYLEPRDAHVIRSERFRSDSLGTKIVLLMSPFHFGCLGGRAGTAAFYAVMVFYTVIGIVPAALAVTGMLMYWNRVLSKRRRKVLRPAADLAARVG